MTRFVSRWLQPLEKGEWDEIERFEEAHRLSYDCANVFAKFASRTNVCFEGAAAAADAGAGGAAPGTGAGAAAAAAAAAATATGVVDKAAAQQQGQEDDEASDDAHAIAKCLADTKSHLTQGMCVVVPVAASGAAGICCSLHAL